MGKLVLQGWLGRRDYVIQTAPGDLELIAFRGCYRQLIYRIK